MSRLDCMQVTIMIDGGSMQHMLNRETMIQSGRSSWAMTKNKMEITEINCLIHDILNFLRIYPS